MYMQTHIDVCFQMCVCSQHAHRRTMFLMMSQQNIAMLNFDI